MTDVESVIVVALGGALEHDPGDKLLSMGREATALAVAEKKGWIAVRMKEMLDGDLEGAAKASLAIV
jgi:hypothetical protein